MRPQRSIDQSPTSRPSNLPFAVIRTNMLPLNVISPRPDAKKIAPS
jgi:hypothetical protein